MNEAVLEEAAHSVELDAVARYRRALALAESVREEWERQGCVLLVRWSNGVEAEAPLLKLLREAERDAERMARAIPRPAKRPGRPPVAVIKPPILTPD